MDLGGSSGPVLSGIRLLNARLQLVLTGDTARAIRGSPGDSHLDCRSVQSADAMSGR